MQLTERQSQLLVAVVLEFQATGRPVGSRSLVDSGVVSASTSTVRYELGRLEELDLLDQPHTSAGRVPTDAGYRVYLDLLHAGKAPSAASMPVPRPDFAVNPATRLDEALEETTHALAEATGLLALVTAPSASGAVIRHIEVLQLQPTMLVVVCITATGDVTRHVVTTAQPIDPGLVDWAGAYLNERVTGMALGQNSVRTRLRSPELDASERAMLALLEPAFTDLVGESHDVHVGGSPALIRELGADVQGVINLVHVLEERRRLLGALRRVASPSAAATRRVCVRVGDENELPELRPLSVVGAAYGMAHRPLGIVGLIGPRTMDYRLAMVATSTAADLLSLLADDL